MVHVAEVDGSERFKYPISDKLSDLASAKGILCDEQLLAHQLSAGARRSFHISLCPYKPRASRTAALTMIGWESLEPAELDYVLSQDKLGDPERALPAGGTSFLEIDAPNIVLVDWKLAEDGKGTIVRLQEMAGRSAEATVQLPHSLIESANLCNALEDNLRPLDVMAHGVRLTFSPNEVLTVRLGFDSGR
jgi:Glycosyl hydrolases family 38 C-terminal beta sandwich domain